MLPCGLSWPAPTRPPGRSVRSSCPARSTCCAATTPPSGSTGADTFARVRYDDVYPGIDLAWYGTQRGSLEYDFIVAPGADPSAIGLELEGAQSVKLTDSGALRIATAAGTMLQRPPVAYQPVGGERRKVESRYEISGRQVQLAVGDYDRSPARDRPGARLLDLPRRERPRRGQRRSRSTRAAAPTSPGHPSDELPDDAGRLRHEPTTAAADAFVTKLNAAGTALVYSTYLGGASSDNGFGIAVDGAGSAYVTGVHRLGGLPDDAGRVRHEPRRRHDAFVTKLNARRDGARLLDLSRRRKLDDDGRGIAVDARRQRLRHRPHRPRRTSRRRRAAFDTTPQRQASTRS